MKYYHCEVCGGLTTCPAHETIVPITQDEILYVPAGKPVPDGYMITHRKKNYVIAIPEHATVVGSNQRYRVAAHHHLEPVWVGQCAYAFLKPEA